MLLKQKYDMHPVYLNAANVAKPNRVALVASPGSNESGKNSKEEKKAISAIWLL